MIVFLSNVGRVLPGLCIWFFLVFFFLVYDGSEVCSDFGSAVLWFFFLTKQRGTTSHGFVRMSFMQS